MHIQPEYYKGSIRKELRSPRYNALRVTLIYFVIGSLWILLSDRIVGIITKDPELMQIISVGKGIFYVVATGVMLYLLIHNALAGQAAYSKRLDDSYAELQANYEMQEASQKRLVESEEQYRSLFNAMLCGYCVHELLYAEDGNPEGIRMLNTNPAYFEIAGEPSAEPEETFLRLLSGQRRFWLDGFAEVARAGSTMHFQLYSPAVCKSLEFTVFRPAPGRFAAMINDITDRKLMEKALDAETEQLRVTLDSIGDGVISVDMEGRVAMLNGVAEKLTGWRQSDALGLPLGKVLEAGGGSAGVRLAEDMTAAFSHDSTPAFNGDIKIKRPGGPERLITVTAAPMSGSDGGMLGFVAVLRDVTERKQKEEEILYLSYHDILTGLYNRAFFEEELRRLDTERQMPLSVIMADANNLKLVNDVFGHVEGDEMLRVIARVLRDSCRAEDIISRWGGDEFTILLPRTDAEQAEQVCRRILAACRQFRIAGMDLFPSVSLGHGTKDAPSADFGHVIKTAEDMMYSNKLLDSRTAHSDFLAAMRRRVGESEMEAMEHAERVAELCVRTGRELNLKESDLSDLKLLALLHDIGKAAIDPRILNKPGSLTPEEWEDVKRHSSIGYRIVRSSPELVLVADYVLAHHERWDGGGYPQRLKGEEIPLAARIFAVADAFVVMTQGRPYRPAISSEDALREIYRNAGSQLDPEAVNAFASVLSILTDSLVEET